MRKLDPHTRMRIRLSNTWVNEKYSVTGRTKPRRPITLKVVNGMVDEPKRFIDDPKHWRGRAEEIRTLMDDMHDDKSRDMMYRIAQDYDRLAERAEARLAYARRKEEKR